MSMFSESGRNNLKQHFFDFQGCFPRSKAGSVANPENVRVDCDRTLVEKDVEKDVGRLSANTGQAFQLRSCTGHFTPEFFNQNSTAFDQVPGFTIVKAE